MEPARTARVVTIILWSLWMAVGCQGQSTPTPTPADSGTTSPNVLATSHDDLTALGIIQPAQRLTLGFATSGRLHNIAVRVGDEVKAGDLLAELDAADLQMAVKGAEIGVAKSHTALEQASAGASETEVALARAEYEQALARHDQLLSGSRPEEIAMAGADYEAALARLAQVEAGASDDELIAADANVERARVLLQSAQAAYDQVAGQPGVGASPQAGDLQQATIDYQAAQAQYDHLAGLPDDASVQEAGAQVARAEAQLELLKAGPSEQEIRISDLTIDMARARLEAVQAGPQPEDVALAEYDLQQAQLVLEQAQLALSRARLLAPFDGVVSAVYLTPNEWGGPGVPAVELLDVSRWLVETRNVGELQIGRVAVGQTVTVRVLAFGDRELSGRVTAISPTAVVQQGDTTYTLIAELEATELSLRQGMNAEVVFVVE